MTPIDSEDNVKWYEPRAAGRRQHAFIAGRSLCGLHINAIPLRGVLIPAQRCGTCTKILDRELKVK